MPIQNVEFRYSQGKWNYKTTVGKDEVKGDTSYNSLDEALAAASANKSIPRPFIGSVHEEEYQQNIEDAKNPESDVEQPPSVPLSNTPAPDEVPVSDVPGVEQPGENDDNSFTNI